MDKQKELPKMGSIYGNAAFTIVAAVAASADKGFLHVQPTEEYFIAPFDVPIHDEEGNLVNSLSLCYPASYKRWKDPINDRAWTFQELLLSKRVISYSYRGVEFADKELLQQNGSDQAERPELDPRFSIPSWSSPWFNLEVTRETIRNVWLIIRSEYTTRDLTYSGDKLVAIAAVAAELGKTYGKYLAGLWEEDLFLDLQWR